MNRVSTVGMAAIVLWGVTVPVMMSRAQGADAGSQLDDAGLQQMLTGLGYEPKALDKGFLVTIKKDGWSYYVQFVISEDKSRLGMNANLGQITDPDSVAAKDWMGLLAANSDLDPSSFNYDKNAKKVYLHRVLDNRGVTPAYVREQIDNFTTNIRDSEGEWKFVK